MKFNKIMLGLIIFVGIIMLGCLIFILVNDISLIDPPPTTATVTTAAPTTTVTTAATTLPTETTEAPTEPPPEEFTLSFAGDCTFAQYGFQVAVKEDYTYPFLKVQDYFANDDCTFVNLECALSNRGSQADKMFTFRGDPAYVNILTQGSAEFASLSNNHAMDYGKTAYDDTKALLEEAGVYYGEQGKTTLFQLERGLKIGVVSLYFPNNTSGIAGAIQSLKEQGAHIVIVNVHWGDEYYFKPSATQIKIGRYAIDNGADIVYGQHPHVLQPIEEYNGGVIFYSLGNFSFGGNTKPADMDTAILQQKIQLHPDGTAELSETNIVPCFISGTPKTANNYQPVPMDPETDAEAYARVMRKLSGEYEIDKLYVSYRDDLKKPEETTGPQETKPSAPTEAPPAGTEAPPVQTEPVTTPPADSVPDEGEAG